MVYGFEKKLAKEGVQTGKFDGIQGFRCPKGNL